MTHCFINSAFIPQTFQCPRALIYLSLSQSTELDIALYNLSSGGGVVTSHQLSLQPAAANRKVRNVAAEQKIREENPENSKVIFLLKAQTGETSVSFPSKQFVEISKAAGGCMDSPLEHLGWILHRNRCLHLKAICRMYMSV